MNKKVFRQYTGTFFNDYKIIAAPSLHEPYRIKGKKILAGKGFQDNIPNLINDLLKITGKTCDELITHMDVLVLSDGRELQGGYPKHFLTNTANSCAIDSILFILFFTKRSYFMNLIYQSTTSETDKGKKFKGTVLPLLDDLYTNFSKWTETAANLQRAIFPFIHFDTLRERSERKSIRFDEQSEAINAQSCADVKSGTEIWSMFADAFTKLQFPYQSIMATYLDPGTDDDPILIKAPFLIYADDAPPMQRDLRPFYNLQVGDYELAAVLFYDTGHYTCAVKMLTKWVYYDDLMGQIRVLKNPEKFIFTETKNHKVQMLIYVRDC